MSAKTLAFLLGLEATELTESETADVIYALADAKQIPLRLVTSDRLRELCADTLAGLDESCHEELLALTLKRLDQDGDLNSDDGETASEYMQDIAADQRYATA